MRIVVCIIAALVTLPVSAQAPKQQGVQECARIFNETGQYVARAKGALFNREISRGGDLKWQEAEDIRNAIFIDLRDISDDFRAVVYDGDVERCRAFQGTMIEMVDQIVRAGPTAAKR